ncbi:unnamed protein product, partial [Didymodactylos carnosus]
RNGSTCIVINHTGDGFCLCSPDHAGPYCEYITPSACRKKCQNEGQCAVIDNKYGRCICPKDVTGSYCDAPLHPCAPNPCKNEGICVHETTPPNHYKCICTYGYSGENCTENLNRSFCSSNPCQNNGTCLESPISGDGICRCDEGFGGAFCQEMITCGNRSCAQYQVCLAETCANVTGELYCLLHECEHGGTCDQETRICQCQEGFGGPRCELRSNFCIQNPCMNNGTCIAATSKCMCNSKYTGKYCENKRFLEKKRKP